MDNWPILSLILLAPLLGMAVIACIPSQRGKWIKTVAMIAVFIPLLLSVWLYTNFDHQQQAPQFAEKTEWIHVPVGKEAAGDVSSVFFQFNYSLAVDGLSLPMIFLTALVTAMAAFAAMFIRKRWKSFYLLFLLLQLGMFGVFMAQDLFLFFVFFELTLIPMFFLIGIWGFMNREKAANTFLIYNGVGSALMFIAFLLLINTAGLSTVQGAEGVSLIYSGDIHIIANHLLHDAGALVNQLAPSNPFYLSGAMKWTLFILLLVAFGIKLPIFPFHTWMLKVHTEAPPAIVMIHSGILLKMGAYGLIRFGILFFPAEAKAWATVLAVLGVVNILYGAILAFKQTDFKLVLAYSSISHMGIVLLGIAAFNTMGMEGAIFQLVSHGLISALMFLIVGSLYERTGTTMIDQLGGLATAIPFISGILLISGMASLGLPGLSGFVSEFLAFAGLFQSMPIITAVGALGIIFTAVYVLRGVMKITYGAMDEKYKQLKDARFVEVVPMITLTAFILLLGVYPSILTQPLHQTVLHFDEIIQAVSRIGG